MSTSLLDSLYAGFESRAAKRQAEKRPSAGRKNKEQSSIVSVLTKYCDDALDAEGLTKGLLDCVDLSIAHSPVIECPYNSDGGLPHCIEAQHAIARAVEVDELAGGGYRIVGGDGATLSADTIRVMRGRYLKAREIAYQPAMDALFKKPRP